MAPTRRRNTPDSLAWVSIVVIVVACVVGAGCTAGTSTPASVAALTGPCWYLDAYLGEDGSLVAVLPGTEISARFDNGGRVTGSAGCNGYGGDYRLDGRVLTVSSVARTLMLCLEPDGIMEQEARFIDLLGSAAGCRIEDDRLIITDAAGTTTLVFVQETAPDALAGTSWTLAGLAGEDGGMEPVLDGTTITAAFGGDGRVGGSAGCNHYGADYTVDEASLSIGLAVRTEMYCMNPPGVMEQEGRYLSLLADAACWRMEDGLLILADREGADLLIFEQVVRTPDLPLTKTQWTLTSIGRSGDAVSSLIAGTAITATFSPDGNVTGSAGCNRYGAAYRTGGTSISIDPPISTKIFCTGPEGVMEQEAVYLSLLGSAAGYRIDGDRLEILDDEGRAVLWFRAERP
ncbi:MAG: META domain-containing protein [Methanomicrobiaceae archaeon]|nr:META domain-containing protein [Methanomicrobiaceae archaeon]